MKNGFQEFSEKAIRWQRSPEFVDYLEEDFGMESDLEQNLLVKAQMMSVLQEWHFR